MTTETSANPVNSLGDVGAAWWFLTKDGDATILDLYDRHYPSEGVRERRKVSQFVGPGEHIVLRTDRGDAGFVWRRFIDDSGQRGVCCSFFRNEGQILSSELIRQADAIADLAWPCARHYTLVDAEKIRSAHPGACFVAAGYRWAGRTVSGKEVLAKPPNCACYPKRRYPRSYRTPTTQEARHD